MTDFKSLQNTSASLPEKITEHSSTGIGEFSIFSLNASNGDVFLNEIITPASAMKFASIMKYMASKEMPVNIYINCIGGEINSGLLIYDVLQSYPYEVNLYCTGTAESMAALILASGKKGHRFILPHSKVMIHEPLIAEGFGGSATTIEKQAQGILEIKALINGILAKHTGRSIEEVNHATAYDNFMNAQTAIEFGICDEIKNIF